MDSGDHIEQLDGTATAVSGDTTRASNQTTLLQAAVGDHCAACGASLAGDQRYCVECGQRRGSSRIAFRELISQGGAAVAAPPPTRGKQRTSLNATLLAVIGVLLLALGVGVLIGRSSKSSGSAKTPSVQVVTVGGGVAAAAGAAAATPGSSSGTASGSTTSGASTTSGSSSSSRSGASTSATSATPSKKAPPPKVVTVGSPGSGPGYQNGHFTGNFFGG
jgi:hypothetical protein